MAATRIIPMHINKGLSVKQCLSARIDYAENGEKTEEGEFISSYACDPKTADEEFMLSKREYYRLTGRTPHGDIIAYQLRQSFKPDEITPQEANQIGYELAMKLTKKHHAFIVATHTDRHHIHNHIIWNSTDLDCTCKYKNFIGSFRVVQRISDQLCLEHGMSVIKPRPFREREKYNGYEKRKTFRSELCNAIDEALSRKPGNYEEFLMLLEEMEYQIKRGRHTAVRAEGHERFIRFDSLGEGYREQDIRSYFQGDEKAYTGEKLGRDFDMLIDIQKKISEGKGAGYENWAKVFNVKQMSKTLIYLHEHGIRDYTTLEERTKSSVSRFNELTERIKSAEKRMAEIAVLRTHIINFVKTSDVYEAYKKSGYSKKFFEAHREELTHRKAAKAAFDELKAAGLKIPKVKELNAEYAKVLADKKQAYAEYREVRDEMKTLTMAKHNVDEFLNRDEKEKSLKRGRERQLSR